MIDSSLLLTQLQSTKTSRTTMVKRLEDDLRKRCDENPDVDAPLKAQYEAAKTKKRTALTYKAWREEELTNVAVAWVLACVFIRFLEDNKLVETPKLSGPGARLQRARDEHELFFRKHPTETEREYLLGVFEEMGRLPGMKEFFDKKHNPLWLVAPSGDACRELWQFWQKTDAVTGALVHDFTDPEWNTRFLGDLYQDLSEAARKRYALLQTPVFIEQFILDRTLTPAIETFGFREVRMIDPTCGSAHFLLGGFDRLLRIWLAECPGENPRVLAQRALDQVFGVDLNPNVVAIARFRLLLAALKACGVKRLKDAPDFHIHVAAGDALLHGAKFGKLGQAHQGTRQTTFDTEEVFRDELKHHYEVEDVEALHRLLGQQYHAVVGNPPYITVKDRAVSELYRARFPSCHRQYSLSVPFMERFFDLAVKGDGTPQQPAGFVGQITANSFMKREFGKKLIEEFLPRWDLTHVVDSSKAHVPGHGTPTVILFGKNQPPVSGTIRTVLGIRGEQATPKDPAKGLVWQAICRHINEPGSASEWVSTSDSQRINFHRHPWSIGGGGAAGLKQQLEEQGVSRLDDEIETICLLCKTRLDDAYVVSEQVLLRANIAASYRVPSVIGESVRDWAFTETIGALFPYDSDGQPVSQAAAPKVHEFLWPYKEDLWRRKELGGDHRELERTWWEWNRFLYHRYKNPASICYSFVATQNNFVFDRSAKVFHGSAPIIKLPTGASETDHLRLLGMLNSSTACFWMKQVFHDKGGGGIGGGIATEEWEHFFEFASTQLARFPLPPRQPTELPTALVKTSTALQGQSPAATLASWGGPESGDLRPWLASARDLATRQRRQLIAWQEELDWQIYEAFGLVEGAAESGPAAVSLPEGAAVDAIPPEGFELGQRAFEIVLARRMAAGEAQSTWFERHGSTPVTEVPRHWPAPYRELVERRLRRIADDPAIRLIEQPEYKRRWNTEPWDEQFTQAARDWLLARLEGYFFEGQRVCDLEGSFDPTVHGFTAATRPHLVSANQLADVAQTDKWFMEVAENYAGSSGFSVPKLVRELVESEAVPYLPIQRYKESGLRKRQDWEHVWDLQRREDKIDAEDKVDEPKITDVERLRRQAAANKRKKAELGDIPVPPKYAGADFIKASYWKLRGKLDVPKERWVSYPGAERAGDDSLLIAWAGWDHLQQAQALAEYYLDAKDNQGWQGDRLKPLLAGLADLIPWLKQWHNTPDPNLGMGLGDYFAGFLDEQCRTLSLTVEEVNKARFGDSHLG
jgi:hypothetical protein